ncbi:MAG: hypothetical protein SGPRY_012790 [Prymnesium sp.]
MSTRRSPPRPGPGSQTSIHTLHPAPECADSIERAFGQIACARISALAHHHPAHPSSPAPGPGSQTSTHTLHPAPQRADSIARALGHIACARIGALSQKRITDSNDAPPPKKTAVTVNRALARSLGEPPPRWRRG